jgi:pseudo-rSAM protein
MLIEKYTISNYAIHPVYTKNNHVFFEEFIYTNREDIFQTKLSFRQIFAHQKLNTHFFGSLTIMPNGEVHANVNSPVLGNISCDTLLDIVNKEMLMNTAWRKVRDTAPCSDCLYQYLCPSPSQYELTIGKPNLCHIKK